MNHDTWLDWTFRAAVGTTAYHKGAFKDVPGHEVLSHCTRLFREPAAAVSRFSRTSQIAGFQFINGADGHLCFLTERSIDVEIRYGCIREMFHLFERLFATDPLDHIAFMWFDSLLTCSARKWALWEDNDVMRLVLTVQTQILQLESENCQRSALHGLNHWQSSFPEQVAVVINSFIAAHPAASPSLLAYARSCATGSMP